MTAYFSGGLWSTSVVLSDTLLQSAEDSEKEREMDASNSSNLKSSDLTKAIVAHELGHWYFRHDLQGLILFSSAFGLFIHKILPLFIRSEAMQGPNHLAVPPLFVFYYLTKALRLPLTLTTSAISRRMERDADAFIATMGLAP